MLGTMHALMARRRGWQVVHLERDLQPRRATVRNFGLVWVSGRRAGPELELALRARELWGALGASLPDVGFRPDGSLTVAGHPAELAVMEELCAQPDAGARGVRLLDADEARRHNPALRGELLGALLCERDAVVEPGRVLAAVRAELESEEGYDYLPGRTAEEAGPGWVLDSVGTRHQGDLVVLCPGAEHQGVAAPFLDGEPLRRCRLQMMQTAPLGERLTTSLADGDSLRYYPAFDLPSRAALPAAPWVVERHRMQLLVSQRAGGELTIGDTHAYDEPFDFAVDEVPYEHLKARLTSILGRPIPPVVRRWAGVYSERPDGGICVRAQPEPGIMVVTGVGGRGMTLSPAIAEQTVEAVE